LRSTNPNGLVTNSPYLFPLASFSVESTPQSTPSHAAPGPYLGASMGLERVTIASGAA
jgi:hypothetical protein